MVVKTAPADLSSGIVVVQVHKCPCRVSPLGSPLPRVDERLGKGAAVCDVVRAAGPLEALSGARIFDGPVAATTVQEAGAARSRNGVGNPGCRDSVDERRFPGTCNDQQHASLRRQCHLAWDRTGPPTMSRRQYYHSG